MSHPIMGCKRINSSLDFHTKSYSYRFECPKCRKGRRYNTNFLGNRFELVCDGEKITRQRRGDWNDERIMQAAREIDELNWKVQDLINDIREESRHPLAEAVADELSNQCLALASARDIAEDTLANAVDTPVTIPEER